MSEYWKYFLTVATLFFVLGHASSSRADYQTERVEVRKYMVQLDALRTTDPVRALSQAQNYLAQHTKLSAISISNFERKIAQIYFENLKETEKAIDVLNKGIARSKLPDSILPLVTYKSQCLMHSGQPVQSMELIRQYLFEYIAASGGEIGYLRLALSTYIASAQTAGRPEDGILLLRQILVTRPELIANKAIANEMAMYSLSVPEAKDESLSWAKVHWLTCDFDEKAINEATELLQKVWIAKDDNVIQSTAFLKALQNPQIENPLQSISFPTLDKTYIDSLIKDLPVGAVHSRVTLLLLQEKNGEAMLVARRFLLDNPGKSREAALQMARVFKATDLNLVRANTYLQYFQTGHGTNPLNEFFHQNPINQPALP